MGFFVGVGPGVSGGVASETPCTHTEPPPAGADNATGAHRPSHYIRGFCAARDRLRVESDLAVAGWAAPAGEPGCGRSAPPRGARDGTAGVAGGDGSALCAAQAAATAKLRGVGLSP